MQGRHPLADLAPRDVVAKAITGRCASRVGRTSGSTRRALGAGWEDAVPDDPGAGRRHGIDPAHDLIPVAPAQHYASGGVRTDLLGRTTHPRAVRVR